MNYIEITKTEVATIEAQIDREQCYSGMEGQRLSLIGSLIQTKTGLEKLTFDDRANIGLRSGLRVRVGEEIGVMELIQKPDGFEPEEYSKLARCRVPNQDWGKLVAAHPETGKVVAFHENGNISAMRMGAYSRKYYDEITAVWALSPNFTIKIIEG